MRKKKLAYNAGTGLILEIVIIICGFILPRLILSNYGSKINGLISSITQFLSIITMMDGGMSVVVSSALYKPLAERDFDQISRIMVSANKFFRTLSAIYLLYVACLIMVYPFVTNDGFGFGYTATLIIAMSVNQFAQYYFGIVIGALTSADQKDYISKIVQTIAVIINTVACAVLIKIGVGIQIVKLTTAAVYLLRPLFLLFYVRRHYTINWRIKYNEEPIAQKWNGIIQHISYNVLTGTDTIILTLFSTLSNVSVYSVYQLITNGIKSLVMSLTSGVMSLLGDLWARRELDKLQTFFGLVVWGIHTIGVFAFGCTAVLIGSFVKIYTLGVTDANYTVPLFAFLITLTQLVHCFWTPYHLMILAGGHYKQTQRYYLMSPIINIIASVILVIRYGLVGVAAGTLLAMVYQCIWMAWYTSKELVKWPFKEFIKQTAVDTVMFSVAYFLTCGLQVQTVTYGAWFALAIKCAWIWLIVVSGFSLLFSHDKIILFLSVLRKK